jgi:NitT/TauT family transport system substrate-binding protein
MSTKSATINFDSGDYTLSDESKFIIDKEFAEIAKINTTARIRIVGNTDNTGSYNLNVELSKKRASAVADYLFSEYGIDRNRMVVVGNGPKDAIADGISGSSEKYRRTDFELIVE